MIDVLTIPAEDCYWVRLPASSRRWTRDRILAGIEEWTPSDVDTLDVDWAVGSDGQVVVLACEPTHLDRVCASHAAAWCLSPDRIPDHVAVPGVLPSHLNLLQGRHTPLPVRRADRVLRWSAVGTSVVIILLLVAGTIRRQAAITAQLATTTTACAAQLSTAIPAALGGTDPDPLARLDQAERLAAGLSRAADGADGSGATALATVLAAWPAQLRLQVDNLAIDANRCTITGSAASVADAQAVANALATAFTSQGGWRMLPLQATSAGAGAGSGSAASVSFTCTAVRERS